MNGISQEELEEIRQGMCRPEGGFSFEYKWDDLTNVNTPGAKIFEIVSGQHFFLLERANDLSLRLFYSSPGTGTRVAEIDLKKSEHVTEAYIGISWSPSELLLCFGPRNIVGSFLYSYGVASPVQFRIGDDGRVCRVGDEGVKVMGLKIAVNGQTVLRNTAIEEWRRMKAEIALQTNRSSEDYQREVVRVNLLIGMIVTGFEVYCRTRFRELEGEGIVPNYDDLLGIVPLKHRKRALKAQRERGISLCRRVTDKRWINFQNYEKAMQAYKTYKIDFQSLLPKEMMEWLQKFIKHRHNVIHVSPLDGSMDPSVSQTREPVHVNSALLEKALNIFDEFIISLHEASLKLRPPSR